MARWGFNKFTYNGCSKRYRPVMPGWLQPCNSFDTPVCSFAIVCETRNLDCASAFNPANANIFQ